MPLLTQLRTLCSAALLASVLDLLCRQGVTHVQAQTGAQVVMSNDDGWATANIRALYATLSEEGYNVRPPPSRLFICFLIEYSGRVVRAGREQIRLELA